MTTAYSDRHRKRTTPKAERCVVNEAEAPTVFIVDDDTSIHRLLKAVMGSAGLHTESFLSAEQFLHSELRTKPGCVVLDMHMPGMTGLDALQRLRKEGFTNPVIVHSADADQECADRAFRLGAYDVISKSESTQVLVDRVLSAIVSKCDSQERAT